ncbi:cation transport protein-domain-containing protein [Flagelloscypha sp. PMI_526]|nr:cation transport protein-domain-containing protein [Flagelloscypha sp. PMI_526]
MGVVAGASHLFRKHLNFYRSHLLFMTFTPLFFSAISYASNGDNHIDYVDHLFNCVSAMTVCGLAVNDLSLLTPWQQVILFIQIYYFGKKFEHLIAASKARRSASLEQSLGKKEHVVQLPWARRLLVKIGFTNSDASPHGHSSDEKAPGGLGSAIRPDMIRRVNDAPKLVNPSGWISQRPLSRRMSDPGTATTPPATIKSDHPFHLTPLSPHVETPRLMPRTMTRTQTIEFAPTTTAGVRRRGRQDRSLSRVRSTDRSSVHSHERKRQSSGVPLAQYSTINHSFAPPERGRKHSGFGGFAMPHEIIGSIVGYIFPVTIPQTTTITSLHGDSTTVDGVRPVPYISFPAIVGRNSTFHLMDSEQLEELGGVEYRALNALLWIIPIYHFGVQLLGFAIMAPYMSTRFSDAFVPPALHSYLNTTWFSLFQAVSAYTNTGMSLVDQSMLPFQTAYPTILAMIFLILAGNTAFVCHFFHLVITFLIWSTTKFLSKTSRLNETLHFLLDHPRRCYIYLFPSHQTWFLLTVVILLTCTDWFFFMVLDIGTPAIETISLGTRFICGLLQSTAVRAAGFAIVPLASLAPGVRTGLTLISVRSTNVYEEQSLGIFKGHDEEEDDENFETHGPRMTVWSRYLALHARRQLSFDMWWIALALRSGLDDVENFSWFNIFTMIFELVSAYGTVGLSLGANNVNYSFAGALKPLSKLIISVVMLRGRHRGLPVAIDRAILLPAEFDNLPQLRLDQASTYFTIDQHPRAFCEFITSKALQ